MSLLIELSLSLKFELKSEFELKVKLSIKPLFKLTFVLFDYILIYSSSFSLLVDLLHQNYRYHYYFASMIIYLCVFYFSHSIWSLFNYSNPQVQRQFDFHSFSLQFFDFFWISLLISRFEANISFWEVSKLTLFKFGFYFDFFYSDIVLNFRMWMNK